MKIVATLSGTDAGKSGLSTYVREVLPRIGRRLRDLGGELVLVGTAEDHASLPDDVTVRFSRTTLGAAFSAPGPNAMWHALRLGELAAQHEADAVLMPAANRRLALTSPVPTVAVVHDLAMLRVARKYDAARTAYARWLVTRGVQRATRVVAISKTTARDVRELAGREDVVVVPNGVDCRRFRPDDDRRARPLARPYVLYPSRLEHPGKNHLNLLRAWARSEVRRTHDLVFCGEDWGAGPSIAAAIGELGIGDTVHVLGRVPEDYLVRLVAHAAAVTMVGLHEGFGLPALEALACGVPVVAADAGALPEVTGPFGHLCDPLDPASIAAAIGRAVSPGERLRARARGPAWARRWDWDVTADALVRACAEAARIPAFAFPDSGVFEVARTFGDAARAATGKP